MTLRPTSRWTWQQACAFWVWLDPRMVELVAPKDGDVYKVFTVDELLADQKKARWRSGYIYPRSRQPRPSWPQYPLGLTPDQFPEPIGSIAAFERAVANGLVVESEFGTFGPAEVMDVTQTAERAAHAAVPTSDTDPQKAEPVTTLEPAMRNNAGDTTDGPDRETSAEVAGSGIDERARSSPNAPVVDAVPVNGDEAKIDETATVQRLAEWIFLQRVRLKERDKLYEVARQNDQLGVFRKSDFLAAYQLVYVSKAHRPPASGWLLQPAYKKRAEEDKNSAVAKVQKGLKDF